MPKTAQVHYCGICGFYSYDGICSCREKEKEMEFQVGDKVRTIIGTVQGRGYSNLHNLEMTRVQFNGHVDYMHDEELELVERPRKEPRLGSIWTRRGYTYKYIYLGGSMYWDVHNAWTTRFGDEELTEVTE